MNKILRIGELLVQAGLISQAQLEVALQDKGNFGSDYRLGEILALRGWIQQETVEFFVREVFLRAEGRSRLRLGEYLVSARLLTSEQVDQLLQEQTDSQVRMGSIAVSHGWLGRQTLDFFLEKFFPKQSQEPDFQTVEFAVPEAAVLLDGPAHAILNPVDPVSDLDELEELIEDELDEEDLNSLGLTTQVSI